MSLEDAGLVLLNDRGTLQLRVGEPVEAKVRLLTDLNGDGRLDAVGISDDTVDPPHAVAALGNGDGTFASHGGARLLEGDRPSAIAVGDLDLDARPDIVVVNRTGVAVLMASGVRRFHPIRHHPLGANWSGRTVAIGDVTGDSWPDVVTTDVAHANSISIFPGGRGGALLSPLSSRGYVTKGRCAVGCKPGWCA